MAVESNEQKAAEALLSPVAVRKRALAMLELARADRLFHFRLDESKLDGCAAFVLGVMRDNYPSLDIPFHARWRHFIVEGEDRWAKLAERAKFADAAEKGRAAYDLAIVSVLLDAGAGADWRYRDARTGKAIGRSEGLALASLDMFASGAFSSDASKPLRVDAEALKKFDAAALAKGFQVSDANPLVGLEGRAALLQRLGNSMMSAPKDFATPDGDLRPGGLFDRLSQQASSGRLPAAVILKQILRSLGPIWPSRLSLDGVALGDCWKHPLAVAHDGGPAGYVPFHKLSQWLSYSLIEPLQWADIEVTDIDGLTGLPEYRNGGLFLDAGVLTLKNEADAGVAHTVDSLLVVEWRALTVALLDEIAARIRKLLGRSAAELPLAKVLEGGTWAAGRRIAREKRVDGSPPLAIISDGTVF
ncbi:URC4/urg3 family protein [Terrarubrum flagellatum]|uniref:URC4/urg3 family protein n=1 Tax=Terrirubrum flagellatum TaxID=2895980 RepID=UPI003144D7FD